MTIIEYQKGRNTVANPTGVQVGGNPAAGLEGGLNPKELMEASLGLCVSLVLKALLERDGKLEDDTALTIEVTAHKDEGGENRIGRFEIKVRLPQGLDAAYAKKALMMAERGCTMGNTLRAGAQVELVELGAAPPETEG